MINFLTLPKSFSGPHGRAQVAALLSWKRMHPTCDITLFGDAPGCVEVAAMIAAHHVPEIGVAPDGTPDVTAMAQYADGHGRHPFLCISRSDLILLSGLAQLMERNATTMPKRFLLSGRTWTFDHPYEFVPDRDWENDLRRLLEQDGTLSADMGHFALCRRGTLSALTEAADVSPFSLDALISNAAKLGWPVIDATVAATALHLGPGNGVDLDDLSRALAPWPKPRTDTAWRNGRLAFTLAVCTYNRADLLEDCLNSAVRQSLSPDDYEILVVDNNSSDDTASIVHRFAAEFTHVRYVFEPSQGLSHARNRALREARGVYVAFIDDECRVPSHWLATAMRVADEQRPEMFGGPYTAGLVEAPKWVRAHYFSTYSPNATPRRLGERAYLSGGNMFVRADLHPVVGDFPTEFGMQGRTVAYGEETAWQNRLREILPNALVLSSPDLTLAHLVRPKKMGVAWLVRSTFSSGRSANRIFGQPARHPWKVLRRLLETAGRSILSGTVDALRRNRHLYPNWRNYLFERTLPIVAQVGERWDCIQWSLERRRGKRP